MHVVESIFYLFERGRRRNYVVHTDKPLQPATTIYRQPYPKDLANQSAIPQPTMQPTTLNLKPIDRTFSSSKRPARRPVPDARQVDPVNNVRPTWEYMASKDGRDRNLIIMLHGVGTS
jgi:hypothetical protein